MQVTTVGLDLAKNIFHVHGVTETGEVAFNRPLRRAQVLAFFERLAPCLIGIEACASSHHWGRELTKLGHTVRLMPPMYVKPYVKRGKSDAVDAEAICEAVTRPTMRFVEIKSKDQQALLSLHRARDFVVRQRTQLINMLRSLAAEFGITIARGVARAIDFAKGIIEGKQTGLPELAQDVLRVLSRQAQLLQTIPGVGPVTASAVAATIGSGHQFKSGREFVAWLGLTPRNHSSGGKERLGKITKMGDRYLRQLIVVGMTSRVRQVTNHPERADPWLTKLLQRKPARLATVAMANKTARIMWAVLTRNEPYRPHTA
ncbi:IS110 family transposase [Tritonibacter scottomollicae]|uniref:IS110 family transposase n=1 Tax=Tritonibacter scottomollicae TaxID=483013 RepID=A0ABZ0HIW4_TRISK|nr:IS110 family transposase [Tritonibacter scottomollicae]WOI34188.1 IS110 family transposase [Tritonibacter scottomollicae]